jgi:octaprenyl-diphosphate synthase
VLDLTASEEVLGKPVASDLREGKATLAIVHAYERATPMERLAIDRVLEDESLRRTSHEEIVHILNRYGSVEYAMNTAYEYAAIARNALAGIPESDAKRALLWMPDFVVAREK